MIFLRHDLLETGRFSQREERGREERTRGEEGGETGAAASIRATVGISPATAAAAAYLEEASQYLFSREFRHYLPLHYTAQQTHTRTYSRKIAAGAAEG